MEGKVGELAKQIIKRWKKLLPEKASASKTDQPRPSKNQPQRTDSHKGVDGIQRYSSDGSSCSFLSSSSAKTSSKDDRLNSQLGLVPPTSFKRPSEGRMSVPCKNHNTAKPRTLTEFETGSNSSSADESSSSGIQRKRKGK